VNIGNVSEVSKVHVPSIFTFEICQVSKFIDVHVCTYRKINRGREVVGAPSGHIGIRTDVYGFLNMNL
jgi:hypothetical protein